MSTENNCIFCKSKCDVHGTPDHHRLDTYRCGYCGEYILPKKGSHAVYDRNLSDKFKIACVLNERRLKGLGGITVGDGTKEDALVCGCPRISHEDLLDDFPQKASDFLNRALLNLSRLPGRPFEVIRLNMAIKGNRLHFFTPEQEGCYAFLRELSDQRYIRFNEVEGGPQWDVFFRTTKF